MKISRTLPLLCFLLLIVSGRLQGQLELPEIRQITTHPSPDFSPAVSPDGKWLAFTSERSGNLDIWVKRLPHDPPVQVTSHLGDDLLPVWSPDSKRLAFISKRRDARGDIWLLTLNLKKGGIPKGKPVQLTNYLGLDTHPSFSPDGKEIVFESDRDGQTNLWIMNIALKEVRRLTTYGGACPSWSPSGPWVLFISHRFENGGDIFIIDSNNPEQKESQRRTVNPVTWGSALDRQPAWAPNGRQMVFIRHYTDTDGDGKITPHDNGSIWQKTLVEKREVSPRNIIIGQGEIQITIDIFQDSKPYWSSQNIIFFTSYRRGGMDIWSIPAGGIVRKSATPEDMYSRILERFSETVTREALSQSILCYRQIQEYFPGDSLWIYRSLIQIGEISQILGKNDETRDVYQRITANAPPHITEKALAELKLAMLPVDPLAVRLNRCLRVIQNYPAEKTAAEARIVMGDLLRDMNRNGESLIAYEQVIQSFPEMRNYSAQARMKIGELLDKMDQKDAARQSYLAVLREFGDIPLWRSRAGQQLLDQIQGSSQERIRGLQEMIQNVSDLPSLVAKAQVSLGKELIEAGLYDQALKELERVEQITPLETWAHAEAKILRADVYGRMGDELKGIFLLETESDLYQNLEGGRYFNVAEQTLFDLLFESAERLKNQGNDYVLAEARYRKALKIRPRDVRVHRGLIESVYQGRRGEIDPLIEEYQQKVNTSPKDPVLLYGLGLALSYYGEKNSKRLLQSNEVLKQALSEDYRLIYPYRTLSYNYERLEQLAEQKQPPKKGIFSQIGRTVMSPIKWLIGLLPFKEKGKQTGYYEKAIQALLTAIQLNDEEQDPKMEAMLVQNLANNFYHLGEFGYKKAYQYYQRRFALDSTFSRTLEKAVIYERVGHCGVVLEDSDKAADYLKTAITIYRNENLQEGVLRNQRLLAFLYHLGEDYENAVEIYQNTASYAERNRHWEEAERDYRNMAYNYHLMGEPEDALLYALKAENILNRENIVIKASTRSTLRVEILGFSIPVWRMDEIGGASAEGFTRADELVLVYGLISKSREALKAYPAAIEYELKRLELFQKQKDQLAQRVCLNRLGVLYYKMSDYEKAGEFFLQSYEKNRKGRYHRGLLTNAVNLANVAIVMLYDSGDDPFFEDGIELINTELSRISEGEGALKQDKLVLLSTLGVMWSLRAQRVPLDDGNNELIIRLSLNQMNMFRMAETYFQEALQLAQEGRFWREKGVILKNLGEICADLKNYHAAFDYLQNAYDLLRERGEEELLWRIQYSLAKVSQKLTQGDEPSTLPIQDPLAYYEQAIIQLEQIPVEEEGSEERLSDRKERRTLYIDAALKMMDQGLFQKAMETIERGREKELADMLARFPPTLKRERHKVAWGNLRYLRSRLQEIRKQIRETESIPEFREEMAKLLTQEERFDIEYRQVMEDIQEEDGVLAYLFGAEPVDLQRIQSIIPEYGMALIYVIEGEHVLLGVAEKDTLSISELPFNEMEIREKIQTWNRSIETDSLKEFAGKELYNILFGPVVSRLEEKEWLLIIPDGILWEVPFAALSDGEMHLLDKLTVLYAPSFTAYRLAWEKRKINQQKGLLVGEILDESIKDVMKESMTEPSILLGQETTEESFRTNAPLADIIHIGRWIIPREENPLTSSLVLSPGGGEDGYFRAHDLYSLDLRASLVVLPAQGEGMHVRYPLPLSFYHSLLYAGVPSVVMPMWPVNREVQSAFFNTFYKNIQRMPASEALAEAQFVVRDQYPEQRKWGGYRLLGYGGMKPDERIQYSRDNLILTVRRGLEFERNEEYRDAIKAFQSALDMAEAMKDTSTVQNIHLVIRRASINGGLWTQAIEYQRRIHEVALHQDDWEKELESMNSLVYLYRRNGQFSEAATMKLKTIPVLQKHKTIEEVLRAHQDLAFLYTEARQFTEAIQWMDKVLIYHTDNNDSLDTGKDLVRKGRIELEGERFWDAHRDLTQGIEILESVPGDTSSTTLQEELATAYQLLGVVSEKLVRYKEGFQYQEKGLTLFQELNLSRQAAQGYQYLANLYWKTGDYRRALSHQQQAMKDFQSLGDLKLLTLANNTLGLIYLGLGDFSKARETQQTALELAQRGGYLADKATILKNLGMLAMREVDYDHAYDLFHQAVHIDSGLGFQRGLAYDYRNLGIVLTRMNRYDAGISYLKSGLSLSREVGDSRNEIQCYYGLGVVYEQMGNRKEALSALDSGITMISNHFIPDLQWRLYRQRARVYKNNRRDGNALTDYIRAVDIVEEIRAELKVEAFKQGFFDDKMDLYIEVIDHLLSMGREDEAFDFVERAKSRNFIDLLGNQSLVLSKTQDEWLSREEEARLAVQEAQDRLASLVNREGVDQNTIEEERLLWTRELENRRELYQNVLISIQAENPELASMVNVDPKKLSEVQALLPDSTALIEYFVTQNTCFLWGIQRDRISSVQVDVTEDQIQETVYRFRQTIQAHLSVDAEAVELYQWLIEPLEKILDNVDHIVLVPHGPLHYLPFAALQDEEGLCLLEKYSLSLVPSGTVLGYCLEKAERQQREISETKILALSNPDLGDTAYDLPFAEKEVQSLQRTFPRVTAHFGETVTENLFRDQCGKYSMIHFACHGVYEPESPMFSALLLTPDDEDDGRLESHEIFGLSLNCDLVTLSACETGLAEVTKGDEIIGLARSFIFAGTPSIVTSLWKVDDLATAVLIKRFYRYLRSGSTRAEALRQAQLLVKENVNSHPAAWAAFGLTGDFQ